MRVRGPKARIVSFRDASRTAATGEGKSTWSHVPQFWEDGRGYCLCLCLDVILWVVVCLCLFRVR